MTLAHRVKGEGPGRPKCVVNAGQIEFLRELGFKWTQIAALLGITTRTLYNIRLELGLVDRSDNFTDITDQDLDTLVSEIQQEMPYIGQRLVRGALRSHGVHVPIIRLQQSILHADPVNTALRWAAPVYRRSYSVVALNSLLHIDANHKLIRY